MTDHLVQGVNWSQIKATLNEILSLLIVVNNMLLPGYLKDMAIGIIALLNLLLSSLPS
jgi:hypothetical protein